MKTNVRKGFCYLKRKISEKKQNIDSRRCFFVYNVQLSERYSSHI